MAVQLTLWNFYEATRGSIVKYFFSKNNKGCKEYKISVSMKAILIGITIAPRVVVLQAALALVCAENLGCKW